MKCPKCSYLGFDTGERCRNCGYDFSLVTTEEPAAELELWAEREQSTARSWDVDLNARDAQVPVTAAPVGAPVSTAATAASALAFEPTMPPTSFRGAPSLPLFKPSSSGEDEPLIKVPSQPRAPLAVRRTPETPRLRAVAKPVERPVPEPELDFVGEAVTTAPPAAAATPQGHLAGPLVASGAGARILAAAIDHAILLAIDGVVLYLTLRIASLNMTDWRALPILPMGTFLGLLKLAYFTAFTCVGGQTIGKMAAGIRVVGDDDHAIDAPHAIHRALAGAVSFLTLGAGFVPALFGSDRRALHDRLAHTRVVVLPTA